MDQDERNTYDTRTTNAFQPPNRRPRQNFTRKPRRRAKRGLPVTAFILCMGISGLFGFLGGYVSNQMQPVTVPEAASPQILYQSVVRTAAVGETTINGAMTIPEIAAMVKDSIVEITTETAMRNGRMRQFVSTGAGSGVILSADGYIVTNHHVVSDAQVITVRLSNAAEYPATVKGMDAKTDLAVIKIEATGLTPAILGDSSALLVGEGTVAVGNPLGDLGGTVTNGIISALDREIIIDNENMSLLQTNAAINPGNSGGGLFNLYGELIGIVNAKSSGSDIEGLGFAIPIDTAKPVIEDIITAGYVRGRIDAGFEVVDVSTSQMARRYRVSEMGLYISYVENGDLYVGDRIISIDGTEIEGLADYNAAMSHYVVGDTVQITVVRNGTILTAAVRLGELKT